MLLEREFLKLAPDHLDGGGSPSEGGSAGTEGATGGTPGEAGASSGQAAGAEGSRGTSDSFTVKIDGVEKQVSKDELITRYQKEAAADKRFQEAAEKEKEATKYVNAIKSLEGLIQSKNVKGIKKLLGDDFYSEILKSASSEPQVKEPEYSAEDLFIANKFGLDINELVASKAEATGMDKPVVGELKTKYDSQAEEIAGLKKQIEDMRLQSQTASIEARFNRVKEQYADFDDGDIANVINIIEKEKYNAEDFKKAFDKQKEVKAKKEADWEKAYLEKKKKQAEGFLTASQSGNIAIKPDEFKNLDGKSKLEKLKQMYSA